MMRDEVYHNRVHKGRLNDHKFVNYGLIEFHKQHEKPLTDIDESGIMPKEQVAEAQRKITSVAIFAKIRFIGGKK